MIILDSDVMIELLACLILVLLPFGLGFSQDIGEAGGFQDEAAGFAFAVGPAHQADVPVG